MTIQNIPFFCLIWIGIGFLFIMVGIVRMASPKQDDYYITQGRKDNTESSSDQMQELFSFFLEEEEKRNQDLRKIVLQQNRSEISSMKEKENQEKKRLDENHIINSKIGNKPSNNNANASNEHHRIIELYEKGHSVEEIAKKLKKGVGEVNLMISLYTMR